VSKFLSDDILNPTAMGSRDSALLFRVSGTKDFEDLQSQIKHHRQVVDEILTQVLPVLQESDHER
jgi:vacuolar-type H+-ATPase subunit F/Vma7